MSRYIKKLRVLALLLLFVSPVSVRAFDVWQYPLAADRDSIFAGVFAAFFAFDFQDPPESEFSFDYPEFYLDYVLPVGLPFSVGLSFDSMRVDQWGIGFRPAYHVNFDVPSLDVYAMYTVSLDIYEHHMVLDHGIRLGLRYVFWDLLCVNVETGYRLESLLFGLSLKLH